MTWGKTPHKQKEALVKEILFFHIYSLIAMKVLSMVFRQQIELMGFDFHIKCASMGIFDLNFSDDLFLMCIAMDRSFMHGDYVMECRGFAGRSLQSSLKKGKGVVHRMGKA